MVVVIWGVAAVGKTTIGKLLAQELGWRFYDADDFQPAANIEKMQRGEPLTDEDRGPWLETLRQLIERLLAAKENSVLACSALKKKYRDALRTGPEVKFVSLRASRSRIAAQLRSRRGHFFDPKLLESQFGDFEEPAGDEDSVVFKLAENPNQLAKQIANSLREAANE